jgi:hypothetical protein
MKKAVILSITAFYLLLTTGMFVCIVHCAAESLVAKPAMHMAKSMDHNGKDCAAKKGCDCCKKHGDFIIKENIKPTTDVQYVQSAVLIHQFKIADLFLNIPVIQNTSWYQSNAPPGRSGKIISLQNCSLLI